MKRREFLNWVGLGLLASSLPVAIAACQPTNEATNRDEAAADSEPEAAVDSTPREDGFAAIGTVAALDEDGFISDKTFQGEQVVVVRAPESPDALLAVNSLCTHQGCSVAWESDGSIFACPCHGSKFGADGSVNDGPATEPLGVFEAKIEADLVLVKVT